MDRGNLKYNTDKYSDSDDTLLPHTPPDTSTWGQLMGAANIMTQQSVADDVMEKRKLAKVKVFPITGH
jgi:hypothetical protein